VGREVGFLVRCGAVLFLAAIWRLVFLQPY